MIQNEAAHKQRKPLSWLVMAVIFTNVGLFIAAGLALYWFGGIGPAVANLKGDRLIADSYSKSFGTAESGQIPVVVFNMTNAANRPITILGVRSSCTCVVPDDIPMTVAPRESRPLRVGLKTGLKAGRVSEQLLIYTDCKENPEILLRIVGQVPISDRSPRASLIIRKESAVLCGDSWSRSAYRRGLPWLAIAP